MGKDKVLQDDEKQLGLGFGVSCIRVLTVLTVACLTAASHLFWLISIPCFDTSSAKHYRPIHFQPSRPNNLWSSRKKDPKPDLLSDMGLDSSTSTVDGRPSKYMSKKAKKQAKRDAQVSWLSRLWNVLMIVNRMMASVKKKKFDCSAQAWYIYKI